MAKSRNPAAGTLPTEAELERTGRSALLEPSRDGGRVECEVVAEPGLDFSAGYLVTGSTVYLEPERAEKLEEAGLVKRVAPAPESTGAKDPANNQAPPPSGNQAPPPDGTTQSAPPSGKE